MAEVPTFHDESLMPITLGSPYRVADYAYPNWGLTYRGEEQALASYRAEWAVGDQQQMELITRATQEAGLGDYLQLLRAAVAETVGYLMDRNYDYGGEGQMAILDIGSGPGFSTIEINKGLSASVAKRTTMWALDPSHDSLDEAMALFNKNGVNYHLLEGTDSERLPLMETDLFDMITAVASVHHHSQIPFEEHLRVLKPGGFAIYADWHQPIWEHPGSVLRFLQAFNGEEWPNREAGLRHWIEVYPQANAAPALPDDPKDRRAIDEITNFWRAYAKIVRSEGVVNGLWPLEGHRPVTEYIWAMREAGFRNVRHRPLLANSSLLQIITAQKAKD